MVLSQRSWLRATGVTKPPSIPPPILPIHFVHTASKTYGVKTLGKEELGGLAVSSEPIAFLGHEVRDLERNATHHGWKASSPPGA